MSPKADWVLMNTLRRESQSCICEPCRVESCREFCREEMTNSSNERYLTEMVKTGDTAPPEDGLAGWPCPRRDRRSSAHVWAPAPPQYGGSYTTFWWPPTVNQNTLRKWDISREGPVHHESRLAQRRIMGEQQMMLSSYGGYHNRPGQGFHFC